MIRDLTERTRQILELVVDAYVETGEPVGSRAISERMGMRLSPASIRAAMAELEARGFLYSPHTSAGRLPTENGLTVFVDGLLECDTVADEDLNAIERQLGQGAGARDMPRLLEEASLLLSGLSSGAGLVFAPRSEEALRQIDFVLLGPGRVLAVLVAASGQIENRLLDMPEDVTATTLSRAANYINTHIAEKSVAEAAALIRHEMEQNKNALDTLTSTVVNTGIASLSPVDSGGHLFVRGQSKLLEDVARLEDLERVRLLIEELENKKNVLKILEATAGGEGVKIFIGAENSLFRHAGCSLIVAPCKTADSRPLGAIGVIGPARLNYRRIIPVINYTSRLIGRLAR